MEIVNPNSASLSNYEVLQHLKTIKDSKKKVKGQLATITYETMRYLDGTLAASQTPSTIGDCLKALEPFNLNKTEKLMLINTPPTTPLEIQLMVEDSEDRLTEEQVGQILEILKEHFPEIVPKEEVKEEGSE